MRAPVVLQTDFGLENGKAAALTGELMRADCELDVYSVQHCFKKAAVRDASAMLYSVLPFWPEETVFVSMVGQSDSSGAVAVLTSNGRYVLTPDNGSLTLVQKTFGISQAVRLDLSDFDTELAAYAHFAAGLANRGTILADLGQLVEPQNLVNYKDAAVEIKPGEACGAIAMILPNFGNITLNIATDDFEETGFTKGETVQVELSRNDVILFDAAMTYEDSFGHVAKGQAVLFNGSSGYMGIALNQDNFIAKYLPEITSETADYSEYNISIKKRRELDE